MTNRILTAGMLLLLAAAAPAADAYKLSSTIPVPDAGGWDYLYADGAGRRLYMSHGDQVDVIDMDTEKVVGTVPDTKGVHGIAIAAEFNRGFSSNGRAGTVTVFDLKTLKKLGEAKAGKNPDSIIYDPASKRVFAFNGGDGTATAIDAATGRVAGTVDVGPGKLEYGAADGAGHVFVNVENKHLLAQIDSKSLKVLAKWSIAPGNTPASLSIDPKSHRLFVGCRNNLLVVIDSTNGRVVDKVPIGPRVDATAFDPETGLIFSSCGDGTVAVVRGEGDKYRLVETIATKNGSRTMALDPKTHKIYLPSVDFGPEVKGARPTMVPKTFAVLVFAK